MKRIINFMKKHCFVFEVISILVPVIAGFIITCCYDTGLFIGLGFGVGFITYIVTMLLLDENVKNAHSYRL